MQWFRLYAEFAYDPKVQSLSETLQRRYIMLLCVTCNGEIDKMTPDELAFTLRIGQPELESTLEELRKHRLIGTDHKPLSWDKRQYKSDSSSERVKRHRDMKRYNTVTVTEAKQDVTAPDTDTEKKVSTGSRLSIDALPDEWKKFCRDKRPDLDPDELFAEFKDYWTGIPGQRGRKLDWFATWRNRVRDKKKPLATRSIAIEREREARKGALTL